MLSVSSRKTYAEICLISETLLFKNKEVHINTCFRKRKLVWYRHIVCRYNIIYKELFQGTVEENNLGQDLMVKGGG